MITKAISPAAVLLAILGCHGSTARTDPTTPPSAEVVVPCRLGEAQPDLATWATGRRRWIHLLRPA